MTQVLDYKEKYVSRARQTLWEVVCAIVWAKTPLVMKDIKSAQDEIALSHPLIMHTIWNLSDYTRIRKQSINSFGRDFGRTIKVLIHILAMKIEH
jgi:hypothetical protein